MTELLNPTLLSPGSRIVVSYPGEPERFFERILGWPVGDGTCWVSIGDVSMFLLEDLSIVAGLFDVTGQSDYLRSVVDLEQNMDAPRRCPNNGRICMWRGSHGTSSWNLRCLFSGLVNDTCLRVDCSHESWVNTSRSRTAFPLAEVLFEREAALPVSCQSAPSSALVSNIDVFSSVTDELVRDMIGRAVFVTENDIVSWRECWFQAYDQSLLKTVCTPHCWEIPN